MSKTNQKLKKEDLTDSIGNLLPSSPESLTDLVVVPIRCKAYSVECVKVNGAYNNFRILTMTIIDGIVLEIERSDAYASFEFIDQLNVLTDKACQHLNMNWKDGLCL